MNDNERRIWFKPQPDITLPELVEILRATVLRGPGSEDGVYAILPQELKRHFRFKDWTP